MSTTLIITSYNHAGLLKSCLDSVFQQRQFIDQVIVVDDCSTDDSLVVLQKLNENYAFTLKQTPTNSGPSKARNMGIRLAAGDYIAFLDSDDYILPSKFEKQIQQMQKHPTAAVCYTDTLILSKDQLLGFTFNDFAAAKSGHIYTHLLKRNCIALHSALVRSDLVKKVLFDETLRQAEDYDFWLRLAKLNDTFIYIDEPLAVYRRSLSSLSSQRIDSIAANLGVLEKIEVSELPPQAQINLSDQRFALLIEQVKIMLENGDVNTASKLNEAAQIKDLPKKMTVCRLALKINYRLGTLTYKLLGKVARDKNQTDAKRRSHMIGKS